MPAGWKNGWTVGKLSEAAPHQSEGARAAFNTRKGWNVATIEPDRIQTRYHDHGTGWFATINPDNLSLCAAPSVDLSKRLDVPGE